MRKFGRIDVPVNNAGYGYLAAIEEGVDDAVRKVFKTNVFGLIGMTRAVLPTMRSQVDGPGFSCTGMRSGRKPSVSRNGSGERTSSADSSAGKSLAQLG